MTIEKELDKQKKTEDKIKNFGDILDELSTTEEKKKLLWKEIYENAVDDREQARMLFTDLFLASQGNSTNHLNFGPLMAKYLERMNKSNDQILRLAELIAKEEDKPLNVDDIFSKMSD
tara:strand:+ start:1290 stop:1643 length:354 start_codon:yes stop_codon:yes gene_type:complete